VRAFQVLSDMEEDGVTPNTITYTALITGLELRLKLLVYEALSY
jgi:hypothetical protein